MSEEKVLAGDFQFKVGAATLLRVLGNGLVCALGDDTIPSLRGVHVELAGRTVTVRATDRYVGSEETFFASEACGEGSFILPSEAVKALTGQKEWKTGDLPVTVSYADGPHEVTVDAGSADVMVVDPVPLDQAGWPVRSFTGRLDGGKKAGKPSKAFAVNPALIGKFAQVVPAEVPEAVAQNEASREDARRKRLKLPEKIRMSSVLVPMVVTPNGTNEDAGGTITVSIASSYPDILDGCAKVAPAKS